MVEHLLAKEKVAGSIPVSRSNLARAAVRTDLGGQVHMQRDIDHNALMNAENVNTTSSVVGWSMGGDCLSVLPADIGSLTQCQNDAVQYFISRFRKNPLEEM